MSILRCLRGGCDGPVKNQSKISVGLVGILALGILFSCIMLAPNKGPPFTPKPAEDNENDWMGGAKNLTEGITQDSLSATDVIDYWNLPSSMDISVIYVIVLTSAPGTNFTLSAEISSAINVVVKNSTSDGRSELTFVGHSFWISVNRNSGDGWYKLELTIINRSSSLTNLYLGIGLSFIVSTIAFLCLAYFQSRGARSYLERFEKMRKPLFLGIIVAGILSAWMAAIMLSDILLCNNYFQNIGEVQNASSLVSMLVTIACISLEILFSSLAIIGKKREAYLFARNAIAVEFMLNAIDIVSMVIYQTLTISWQLGTQILSIGLTFIVISRIARKILLTFYGRSYGVLSFRKGNRINQVFREKYGELDEVPLSTLMTDFHFNPKNSQRAEEELTQLIQKKTVPGEYDPGTKIYYPQGAYSTKGALEKMTGDQRQRLLEMVQKEGKIDVTRVKESVGLGETDIKGLIFDLVGEGKFEGKFSGNEFILTSDIGTFISALDTMFSEWGAKTKAGEGKKVE